MNRLIEPYQDTEGTVLLSIDKRKGEYPELEKLMENKRMDEFWPMLRDTVTVMRKKMHDEASVKRDARRNYSPVHPVPRRVYDSTYSYREVQEDERRADEGDW